LAAAAAAAMNEALLWRTGLANTCMLTYMAGGRRLSKVAGLQRLPGLYEPSKRQGQWPAEVMLHMAA